MEFGYSRDQRKEKRGNKESKRNRQFIYGNIKGEAFERLVEGRDLGAEVINGEDSNEETKDGNFPEHLGVGLYCSKRT